MQTLQIVLWSAEHCKTNEGRNEMINQQITVIENAQIVLENGILWDGVLLLEGEQILRYGSVREMKDEIPENAVCIDAKGAYVGPGFVDIHVHGGNGYSTCYNPVEASEFFLRHGTTSLLATTDYHMTFERFLEAIRCVKAASSAARTIRGFYMEGPYTNPDYGSHSYENPWRVPIVPEQFKALVDEAGTMAKVWTVAPERPGLIPFLEYAKKVNPDVVIAVGHSEATPAQIRSLGKYRPTLLTHALNATGRVNETRGLRGYGPDEYCMKQPEVYAELISDSCGIHVHPDMQQLLLHNKGLRKMILITDSTTHNKPVPEKYAHVKDLNFDDRGGLAGSRMTMELACQNIMTHTNCGIAQAFLMAATNPAKAVGLDQELGSIACGKRADLVFVDDRFRIQQVMLGGELCRFE